MVIGRGTISQVIKDRDGFIFYANGCSNRTPLTNEQKAKEFEEVSSYRRTKDMFVYVSGLNIYYSDSEYTKHKLGMEEFVKNHFSNYCIFRLGSVTWGDNPNTLVNFIKNNPNAEAQQAYRYLHTKEELAHWFSMIPKQGKHEMNVTGKMVWMPDVIEEIKQGKYGI